MYNIIIGRDKEDLALFGNEGLIFLGKTYVQMGRDVSLANPLYLDIATSHTLLLCGKKNSGKSYSLAVIAEGIVNLPSKVRDRLSVVMFDTMGIFWTMKYKNEKDVGLLKEWGIEGKALNDIDIYVPEGYFERYKEKGIPVDYAISIKPSELNAEDWCNTFEISKSSKEGVLISRVMARMEYDYDIKDVIKIIEADDKSDRDSKNAAIGMFEAAISWGLFSKEGMEINKVARKGRVSVIDLSAYASSVGVKALVVGLIGRKLLNERMLERKEEELDKVRKGYEHEEKESELPMIWLMIDEAHQFLERDKITAATETLQALLREGRQPGISLVLATQQPGKIHDDALSQADIVLCHRITAKQDIDALNAIRQSYAKLGLTDVINNLPKEKGAGVVLDDANERIYPIRVRPRISWHGGESPSAVKKI